MTENRPLDNPSKIEASKKGFNKLETKIGAAFLTSFLILSLYAFNKKKNSIEANSSSTAISDIQKGMVSSYDAYEEAISHTSQEINEKVIDGDILKKDEMKILPKNNLVTHFDGPVEIFAIHDGKKYPLQKLFNEKDYGDFDKTDNFFIQATGSGVNDSRTFGIKSIKGDINVTYGDNMNEAKIEDNFKKNTSFHASGLVLVYNLDDKNDDNTFFEAMFLKKQNNKVETKHFKWPNVLDLKIAQLAVRK